MQNIVDLEHEVKMESVGMNKYLDDVVSEAEKLKVKSQVDLEYATDLARKVEKFKKQVDDRRKHFTKPLDDAKKIFQETFMPAIKLCDLVSSGLRQKMSDYVTAKTIKHEKQQEETDRLVPVKVHSPERSTFVKSWSWKIDDVNQLPREYLCVDEAKLNIVAKLYESTPQQIPGVSFSYEMKPIIRK